jgi:hypothetical protein
VSKIFSRFPLDTAPTKFKSPRCHFRVGERRGEEAPPSAAGKVRRPTASRYPFIHRFLQVHLRAPPTASHFRFFLAHRSVTSASRVQRRGVRGRGRRTSARAPHRGSFTSSSQPSAWRRRVHLRVVSRRTRCRRRSRSDGTTGSPSPCLLPRFGAIPVGAQENLGFG